MTHRKGHVWTAGKLDFLERYLPAFNTIVRRHFPESIYVDGYAGPGTNQIQDVVRRGSPLIAVETTPAFTQLYLIEKGRRNAQQLSQNLNGLQLPPERQQQVHVQQGDFNTAVDGILSVLPNQPTFFFLDPEGLELSWDTVRKIGCRRRADLFILVSAGGVTRCAGHPPAHGSVTQFYGHERWRPIAEGVRPDSPIGETKFEAFIQLYLEGLRGLGFAHVERFLIATNSQNSNMHALVFAAKNDTAIKIAEQILNKIQKEQRGTPSLFD
jgi:three-Cys-motif partner protein